MAEGAYPRVCHAIKASDSDFEPRTRPLRILSQRQSTQAILFKVCVLLYTYIGKICADPLNVDTKCEREGRSTVLSRPAAHHWPPGWQSCPTSLTQASADDHIIQTRHAICKKILSVDVPQRGVGEFTHHSLHHCHGCCCTSSGPDPQAGTFRLTAYHVLMNVFSGTLVIPKNRFVHPPRPSLLRTAVENSKQRPGCCTADWCDSSVCCMLFRSP